MFCTTDHQNIRLHTNSASTIRMKLQLWLDSVLRDEANFVAGDKHLCHVSSLKDAVKTQQQQVRSLSWDCAPKLTTNPLNLYQAHNLQDKHGVEYWIQSKEADSSGLYTYKSTRGTSKLENYHNTATDHISSGTSGY
jgi:hypothetical protein